MSQWEKVDKDDPLRCQGVNIHGQCTNKALKGSDFCPAHGGNKGVEAAKRKEMRNYRLAQFQSRVSEFSDSDHIIGLREEIGILRLLMEEKLNSCTDAHELLLMSGPLSDLAMKIDKIVSNCNRLESKLGGLLDREKILESARTIIQIISKHIKDDETLDAIAEEILTSLE